MLFRRLPRRAFRKPAPSEWYSAAKRFGFVVRDDGGKDIFVHASVLQRAGIGVSARGSASPLTSSKAAKGPEASSIRLA